MTEPDDSHELQAELAGLRATVIDQAATERHTASRRANKLLKPQSDPKGRWEVVAQVVSEGLPIEV